MAETLYLDAPADVKRWDALVDGAPVPDVYYRPGYVRAYQEAGHGRGVAVLLEAGGCRALVPLLLRPLADLAFAPGSAGVDAVTPYGYGGLLPLSATSPPAEPGALVAGLQHWCRETDVVACLLRLHPLLRQEEWFSAARLGGMAAGGAVELRPFGPTTALDLGSWNERKMRASRRHRLNHARQQLQVRWFSAGGSRCPSEGLASFEHIYNQRMQQLAASDFYYFPSGYYQSLADGLGDRLAVAIAAQQDEPVAAAMFLADAEFAHYHLSGSSEIGRERNAPTLLLAEAAAWARARGCRMLHLGGGVRGADSLFDFKRSFGGDAFVYAMLNVVGNQRRYDELLARRLAAPNLAPPRPMFFPQYRA